MIDSKFEERVLFPTDTITTIPERIESVYVLAFSAWESGNVERPELRQEVLRLYEYLTGIFPSDALAQERLQILRDPLAQ